MSLTLEDLILAHRDYYGTYHHHKENMAYTVTGLYLGAAAVLLSQAGQVWKLAPAWVIVVLALSSSAAGFAFVIWQLRQREVAADIVMACTSLLSRMVSVQQQDITPDKYKKLALPKVLVDELNSINNNREFFGGPRVSESITYLVMLVWTLGAFISLCRAV